VLDKETTKKDFFRLPMECLRQIFSSSDTLLSEIRLFRIIEGQIVGATLSQRKASLDSSKDGSEGLSSNGAHSDRSAMTAIELQFLREMITHIRLPLICVKHLVAEIKLSGYFNDQHIFEAI
jgi:hypothetical protein